MANDAEMLTNISVPELEALAQGVLAPACQARIDELLALNSDGLLSPADERELDRLLEQADQLTLLKTRARYTLSPPRRAITHAMSIADTRRAYLRVPARW